MIHLTGQSKNAEIESTLAWAFIMMTLFGDGKNADAFNEAFYQQIETENRKNDGMKTD